MTENKAVTPDTLNAAMEFDHVIRVAAGGTVSDSPLDPYFDLHVVETSEGHWEDEFSIPEGWELLRGYTGQYGYSGPVMHQSEYIGGGMAEHILETPGDYVALVVESEDLHQWQRDYDGAGEWCPKCGDTKDKDNKDSLCHGAEPAGWAVAFKPADTDGK